MAKEPKCTYCGEVGHYQTFCRKKKRKPIAQKGKETLKYERWRDEIAKPYLDKKFGHVCALEECYANVRLEVDHIQTRGGHHEKKFDLNNIQYLCWYHHRLKTDGKL